MTAFKRGLASIVLWLDIFATLLLLFILVGLWLYRDRVFTIGSPLGFVGLTMLVGFVSILLFNIVSIAWLSRFLHDKTAILFGLGILCLVLMAAEKVMVDEVAHETAVVWSIQGEYLMLYGMLILQLIYNLLVGGRVLRSPAKAI